VLKTAFANTCEKRGSSAVVADMGVILGEVENSPEMMTLWHNYQRRFEYAADIGWNEVMRAVRIICDDVR
jgi:hypothetical protein